MAVDSRWQFEVEEAFAVTGRGTAVIGQHRGGVIPAVGPAVLCVGGASETVERVAVEVLDRQREGRHEGRVALLLCGVDKDRVPAGAVVRSMEKHRRASSCG